MQEAARNESGGGRKEVRNGGGKDPASYSYVTVVWSTSLLDSTYIEGRGPYVCKGEGGRVNR